MVNHTVRKQNNPPKAMFSSNGASGLPQCSSSAQTSGIFLWGLWVLMWSIKTWPRQWYSCPCLVFDQLSRIFVENWHIRTHLSICWIRKRNSWNYGTFFHSIMVQFRCLYVPCRSHKRSNAISAGKCLGRWLLRPIHNNVHRTLCGETLSVPPML